MKMAADKPWRDEELMRELYHGKRMTQREIAEHFDNDITPGGIGYCLGELGIEKRSRSESAKVRWQKFHLRPYTDSTLGYETIEHEYDDVEWSFYIHRLLAVAKFGFDEVRDKVVHHKSEVEWDNRWSNIELMTRAEHASHHHHEKAVAENSL